MTTDTKLEACLMEQEGGTRLKRVDGGASLTQLIDLMPYGTGQFRFVDEFLEADQNHIVARFCFRKELSFFADHFPDRPVTPGVLILEAMCQCGMVAQGLYLLTLEMSLESARSHRFLFTNSEVEWFEQVQPGATVIMRSRLISWRRRRIRASVEMSNEAGAVVAKSIVCGAGVLWNAEETSGRTSAAIGTKD